MEHSLETVKLHGGAELLLVKTSKAPAFYIDFITRSGFSFGPKGRFEVPHLLEHVMSEGNKVLPDSGAFKFETERAGGARNASTSDDFTRYYITAGIDKFKQVVDLMVPYVFQPLLKEEHVARHREVISSELTRLVDNDMVNRQYNTERRVTPWIAPEWPDRLRELKAIEHKDIVDYYQHYYAAANMKIIVAGHLTQADQDWLVKKLNDALKDHPVGEKQPLAPRPLADYRRSAAAYKSVSDKLFQFQIGFIDEQRDRTHRYALAMLRAIYALGGAARIQDKARAAGLSYTVATGFGYPTNLGQFDIADQTEPKKLHQLFELCLKELADVAAGNFSDDEFDRARGLVVGSFQRAHQTAASLASWYGGDFLRDRELESPERYIEQLLKVTKEDIIATSQYILRGDNWILTLMGRDLDEQIPDYIASIDKYFPLIAE